MGKSKGVKYSSYLDNIGQLRLEKFCAEFNCSKAKAISYLLELWENGTIDHKLATISTDIYSQLEKTLEIFLTSKLEEKLATLNQEISKLKAEIDQLSQSKLVTQKRDLNSNSQ
jgi:uncharacterized small protein (DUF1192 family)